MDNYCFIDVYEGEIVTRLSEKEALRMAKERIEILKEDPGWLEEQYMTQIMVTKMAYVCTQKNKQTQEEWEEEHPAKCWHDIMGQEVAYICNYEMVDVREKE